MWLSNAELTVSDQSYGSFLSSDIQANDSLDGLLISLRARGGLLPFFELNDGVTFLPLSTISLDWRRIGHGKVSQTPAATVSQPTLWQIEAARAVVRRLTRSAESVRLKILARSRPRLERVDQCELKQPQVPDIVGLWPLRTPTASEQRQCGIKQLFVDPI